MTLGLVVINFVQWGVSIHDKSLNVHVYFCIPFCKVWPAYSCSSPQLSEQGWPSTRYMLLNILPSVFQAKDILITWEPVYWQTYESTLKGHKRTVDSRFYRTWVDMPNSPIHALMWFQINILHVISVGRMKQVSFWRLMEWTIISDF